MDALFYDEETGIIVTDEKMRETLKELMLQKCDDLFEPDPKDVADLKKSGLEIGDVVETCLQTADFHIIGAIHLTNPDYKTYAQELREQGVIRADQTFPWEVKI